jgi:hypothetical protein
MRRERALKIVLLLVGLLFTAMIYPLVLFPNDLSLGVVPFVRATNPVLGQPDANARHFNRGLKNISSLERFKYSFIEMS